MAETFKSAIDLVSAQLATLAEKIKANDAQALSYEESAKIHRLTANTLRKEYDELRSAQKLLEGAFDSPAEQVAERDPNG